MADGTRVGTGYVSIEPDFSGFQAKLGRQLSASMAGVGDRAGKELGRRFGRSTAVALKAATAGAVAGAGALTAKAVKDGIAFNRTMESNRLALERFVGGGEKAQKFLDGLFETAKQTPFEMTDLATASRRLLAFGLEARKTQRVLAATGDAIAAMGGGAENIDRVTLALGQMQAKGKVSAEELLQLTEAGIPAQKILQDELGLTGDQIANIGNEGISAERAIDALTRGMEKRFGGAAAEQAKTWDGLTSTISDNWAQMTGALTEDLFVEAKRWLPVVNNAMGAITELWQRDDLTFAEKFDAAERSLARDLRPLLDEIEGQLEGVDVGDALSTAFAYATPKLAEASAQAAPVVARAFFDGWRESDIWQKLIIASWLLAKFGGLRVFRGLGAQASVQFGAGMASAGPAIGRAVGSASARGTVTYMRGPGKAVAAQAGAALGTGMASGTAAGFAGRLKGQAGRFRAVGKAVLGTALVAGIADAATREGIDGLGDRFQQLVSSGTLGLLPAPRDVDERMRVIVERIKHWQNDALTLSDAERPGASLIRQKDLDDFTARERALLAGMARLRNKAAEYFGPGTRLIDSAWSNPARAQRDLRTLVNEFGRMRSGAITDVRQMRETVSDQMGRIERTLGLESRRGRDAVRANFTEAANWIRRSMSEGRGLTDKGAAEMARLLRVHTKRGKDGLKTNMDAVIDVLGETMRRGGIITDDGFALIRNAYVTELRMYGLSPKQALNEAKPGTRYDGGPDEGTRGIRRQRGGPIFGGLPSGDSIPAMLERGEYVLNRKAVAKVGRKALDTINFGAAPRFQTGGIVELLHPFNDPAGHGGDNSHLHIAMSNIAALVALGRKLQRLGWIVGEQPSFGSVGQHSANSYHYSGHAIDVNWPDPSQEAAKIRALLPMLEAMASGAAGVGAVGRAVEQIGRVIVGGRESPLRTLVQGALDRVRGAANERLASLGPVEGAETGVLAAGAMSSEAVMDVWREAGGPGSLARTMDGIAYRESRRIPTARGGPNSDGTYDHGLWQINDIHRGRFGALFNRWMQPLANAKMAVDLYRAAGLSPWAATAQLGGLVGLQKGGMAKFGKQVASQGRKPGLFAKSIPGLVSTATDLFRRGQNKPAKAFLHRAFGAIDGIGLSKTRLDELYSLTESATKFGEFASYAERLNGEDKDGNPIIGIFGGADQGQWLRAQLDALFNLRNRLIEADAIVEGEQQRVAEILERVRKQLAQLKADIEQAAARKRSLEHKIETGRKQLDKLRKHPKKNKSAIASLRSKVMGWVDRVGEIEGLQKFRVAAREALGGPDGAVSKLVAQQGKLGEFRGGILGSGYTSESGKTIAGLLDIQGAGGPAGVLGSVPALGTLGGEIFNVQASLQALLDQAARVKDDGSNESDNGDDTAAEYWKEQTRLANLRTALSESAFDIFKQFPVFDGIGIPFGGEFATGGVVPGPLGAPRAALVHGGEGVFTPDQMAAIGHREPEAAPQPVYVQVVVHDGAVDPDRIAAKVVTSNAFRVAGNRLMQRAVADVGRH